MKRFSQKLSAQATDPGCAVAVDVFGFGRELMVQNSIFVNNFDYKSSERKEKPEMWSIEKFHSSKNFKFN